MRALLALLLLLGAPAPARGQAPSPGKPPSDFVRREAEPVPLPEPLEGLVAGMKAGALATHVAFLASPALLGRGLDTPGLSAAAGYAASHLSLAGIPPLRPGDGKGALAAYFQAVPVREIREPGGTVTIERREGATATTRTLVSGVDALVPPATERTVSGPAVFAGYGIRETSPARDDYRGLDVKGRVVVLLEGLPPGEEWRTKALRSRYAAEDAEDRWAAKVETARSLGALAVVGVEGVEWAARVTGKDRPPAFVFRGVVDESREAEPLLVRVSPAGGQALLGAGPAPSDQPRSLPGVTVTVRAQGRERLAVSQNVVGFLEGSDPERKGEAVVVGAHVDHLGREEGVLHPGADDNASGVASLLEIARALASSPRRPKRSVVFAFWTGEEEDKIGSTFWVSRPPWPLSKTTAYLNLDMVGHPWSRKEIEDLLADAGLPDRDAFLAGLDPADFVEPGLARYAPELGDVLVRAGRGTGLALHLDWTEGVTGGSDYRPFARKRVPFVRFFGNFFPGYHGPGDTAEALDASQVLRMARLALATTWLLADR